ncbi:GerMN domain-containing protein [Paenibacillus sp. F411]|uniref:GerMN domain-containing protein n=1 Tax=Paenibacillus sp. F411 TaxID=2820239 RepID=UPI001AAE3D61|nr:GerMN domain-containing protein [Paenibacillus sp. F411]MBO2943115.1 GerMN domain-containing protein [Paenibacillus sp. F411]
MNKKIGSAAFLAAFMLLGTACGEKPGAAPVPAEEKPAAPVQETAEAGNEGTTTAPSQTPSSTQGAGGSTGGSEAPSTSTPQEEAEPAQQSEEIKVYYTDPDLMELLEDTAKITYTDEKAKYQAAYDALQKSTSQEMVPLWSNMKLLSLSFEDGDLTLDLHMPDTANMGSTGEDFAIRALKGTYFQFDEVETIQLLLDGKQVESLMGHVTLYNPETR